MRYYAKKFVFVLLGLMLSSCAHIYGDKGLIQNRNTDYLKAQSIPPLKIPPGVSSSTIQELYPVSTRDYPTGTQPLNLVPPGLY